MERKSAYTRAELQAFVVQTALGYYYQNPDVQYDSLITADGFKHMTSGDAPETASYDSPVYSVCSDYTYDVWHNAFGYELMGGPHFCATKWMAKLPADDPRVVCKFGGEGGETDIEKAMRRARECLQPGDLIVGYGKTGHIMLYVGDAFGDGGDWLLHCWGGRGDRVTGKDKFEEDGAIVLQNTDECCFRFHQPRRPGWFLANPRKCEYFTILRPLDDPAFEPVPTPAAVSRVRYPGIVIDRDLDRPLYHAVCEGEEIPVTVTVSNRGRTAFSAVPVTELLPEGQELVSGSVTGNGKTVGDLLCWTVDVPAGGAVQVGYRVRIHGQTGQKLVFPAGSVAEIATRRIVMVIGKAPRKAPLTDAVLPETAEYDLNYVNLFYRQNLGFDPGLPETAADFLALALQHRSVPFHEDPEKTAEVFSAREDSPLAKMILPRHVTGYYADTRCDARSYITAYREEFYQPGDVFLALSGENVSGVTDPDAVEIFLYLGGGSVLSCTRAGGAQVRAFGDTVALALKYNIFVGLRPTLVHEDLNAK